MTRELHLSRPFPDTVIVQIPWEVAADESTDLESLVRHIVRDVRAYVRKEVADAKQACPTQNHREKLT